MLDTLLAPQRLDLFTGRRLKPECFIRDRLVERGRDRRDPVERLPIPQSGDGEQNTELPIDLQLVEVGTGAELVEFKPRPMTGVLRPRDAVRSDRRPTGNLGAPRRLKSQRAQKRYRVQHDLKLVPDATPHAGIVLVAVGTVSLVPHPPQRAVSDGVEAIPRTAVMLDAGTLAVTPDPYGLLNFGRSRLTLTDAERCERRTPTLVFLRVGSERGVQTLLMPPDTVRDLDPASGRISTMQDYKQSPKVSRIHTRVVRRSGHRRQPSRSHSAGQPVSRDRRTGMLTPPGCRFSSFGASGSARP